MSLTKITRVLGLCAILSATAFTAFANPPAPQACSCEYCPRVSNQKSCINWDGTTITCGYFLAVTSCPAG